MPLNDPSTPGWKPKTRVPLDPKIAEALNIARGVSPGTREEKPAPKRDPLIQSALSIAQGKNLQMTADEFAAAQLGQEKLSTADLGPISRAKVAFLADTEDERALAFKKLFPEGDYLEVETKDGPTAVFRTSASEEFSKLDKSAMEEYRTKGLGAATEEVLGDIAEFASPGALQTLADLAIFKGRGGVVINALKAAASSAVGESARQGAQYLSDTQEESTKEVLGEVAGAGLAGGVGAGTVAGASKGLGAAKRLATGGVFGMREGAKEASESAARLGIEPFGVHQLAESPILSRIASQSKALTTIFNKADRLREKQVEGSIRSLVDENARANLISNAREVMNITEDGLKAIERNIVPQAKGLSRLELGRVLRESHKEIDSKYWKPSVDAAYNAARAIEEPAFDLNGPIHMARELQAGVWTPSHPIEVVVGKDQAGKAIKQTIQEPIRLDSLKGETKKVVEDLLKIDPTLPATIRTPKGIARVTKVPPGEEYGEFHAMQGKFDEQSGDSVTAEAYRTAAKNLRGLVESPSGERDDQLINAVQSYLSATGTADQAGPQALARAPGGGRVSFMERLSAGMENESEPFPSGMINPKLALSAAKELERIAEYFGPSPISRTDRIRALIERVNDAALPGPGGIMRRENYVALQLKKELQNVLDNPVNQNKEFVDAWKTASKLHHDRMGRIEAGIVRRLVTTEAPEDVVDAIIEPGVKPSNLLAMKQAIKPDAWSKVQWSFFRKVLNQKENIDSYLARFDENALEMLLPGNYKEPFQRAARGFRELAQSGIPEALEKHTSIRGFTDALIDKADSGSIDALASLIRKSGGPQSEFGRSIRAAVLDKIVETATMQAESEGTKISSSSMRAVLKNFEDRNVLKLLPMEDLNLLRDARIVSQFAEAHAADVGASIEGTSVSKGVIKGNPWKIWEYLYLASIGRVLTSDNGRKMLINQAGKIQPNPAQFASFMGATLSELARQNNKRKEGGQKGFEELERLQRHRAIQEAGNP